MWNYNPLTVLVIQMPTYLNAKAVAQIEDALNDPTIIITLIYIQ
jgi:hypothetical protein